MLRIYIKKLADQVRYFKENEEGVKTMSGMVEELIDDEKKKVHCRCWRAKNSLIRRVQIS